MLGFKSNIFKQNATVRDQIEKKCTIELSLSDAERKRSACMHAVLVTPAPAPPRDSTRAGIDAYDACVHPTPGIERRPVGIPPLHARRSPRPPSTPPARF